MHLATIKIHHLHPDLKQDKKNKKKNYREKKEAFDCVLLPPRKKTSKPLLRKGKAGVRLAKAQIKMAHF